MLLIGLMLLKADDGSAPADYPGAAESSRGSKRAT
jgi:hypothetical protein